MSSFPVPSDPGEGIDFQNMTQAVSAPRPERFPPWIVHQARQGGWLVALIHVGAFCVLFNSPTWLDWLLFPLILYVRSMALAVGSHRYFSHRSFKTSRVGQFLLAWLCCCNVQRGPLWWAAVHRQHHLHSDGPGDIHSPVQGGFLYAYCGWVFVPQKQPDWGSVRDLTRFPELMWLEQVWMLPGLVLAGLCYLVGGWGMVGLDFCVTTVVTLHGAFLVNSLGHLVGSRRYPTPDQSRNSFLLALITFGEGWHNNHHYYPHAAQAGFFWWEIDGSFTLIRALRWLGLVWDVRVVPPHKLHPPQATELDPTDGAIDGATDAASSRACSPGVPQ
jgi:stearoyl-CoA desaturase (delta-9 desaturase)